jgi:hypothetical protein
MLKVRSAALFIGGIILIAGMWTSLSNGQQGGGQAPAAQQDGGGRGGRGGDRGGDFRQRMAEMIKERLGASDDEWKVLQPRIEKVTTLQMQSRMGGMGWGGRRRGGDDNANANAAPERPQTDLSKAQDDLRTTLEDKAASNDTVKAKLEALRAAREKNKQEIVKAQQELREILTLRQEAQLVAFGTLD